MKKTISLITALALCLSLCVGGVNADSASNGKQSKEETIEQAAPEAKDYAQIGQEINVGSAAVTFSAAKLTYTIGESFFYTAQDDMRFFGLVGTIKNTGGKELPVDMIRAEMVFNGEYTYSARATIGGNRNTTTISVAPLAKAEYWIYAEIPETLVDMLSTCEVRLSVNENFASCPESVGNGDYNIKLYLDEESCKSTLDAVDVPSLFFAECPILPTPVNYSPVWKTSSSSSSTNGKVTSIKYGFAVSFGRSDDINEIYNTYLTKLQNLGLKVQNSSNTSCDVYSNGTKLASVSVGGSGITFSIIPGNENVPAPSGFAEDKEELSKSDPVVKLGETIKTDYFSMKLEKHGSDTEIRSGSSKYGTYSYYSSDNGDPFFYVYGNLKNLGGKPVDVRNIYVQFCFDGKYNYRGTVEGVSSDYSNFITDVSPLASADFYMYTSVPQELINSFSTCTVRVGFTKNFDYKIVDVNDLPKFENCDDIFSVEIKSA